VITAGGEGRSVGDPAAVFPWWSFTKTVLAICALRLVAKGRLALDGSVAGHTFTLRQMLQHRTGLPFCTNACYHFPDLVRPCTVVCFSNALAVAVQEHAALALAYPNANSIV